MTVRREAAFDVELAASDLAERIAPALMEIGLSKAERAGLTFTARKGFSWRSFGEHITVHLAEVGARRTRVTVTSASLIVTTMIDWGSGNKNVRDVQAAVLKAAGSRGVV